MIPRKYARLSSYTGLLLCGTSLAALPGPALAATYYVASTGADSNPGTSSAPWATIQHAANLVAPGDTVHVASGTYNITTGITASRGRPNSFATSRHFAVIERRQRNE